MPIYTCVQCNFNTNLKSNYLRHLKTQKHLRHTNSQGCSLDDYITSEVEIKMSQNEPQKSQNEPQKSQNEPQNEPINLGFHCKFCGKEFATKANMRRHELHRCNNNKKNENFINIINEKNIQIKEEKKEKKKLYKHIEKLLEKVGDTINNNTTLNNTTNTTNNNTTNIHINNYGSEDLSHLTGDMLTKLLNGPCSMISNLTKMIHFNEDKPQNMNIFIPNKRGKYIKVYKDDEWILEDKKECIPDLVDKNYNILDNHFENNENLLNPIKKLNYKKIQNSIDTQDKDIMQKNCELVELEILNGSDKYKEKFIS